MNSDKTNNIPQHKGIMTLEYEMDLIDEVWEVAEEYGKALDENSSIYCIDREELPKVYVSRTTDPSSQTQVTVVSLNYNDVEGNIDGKHPFIRMTKDQNNEFSRIEYAMRAGGRSWAREAITSGSRDYIPGRKPTTNSPERSKELQTVVQNECNSIQAKRTEGVEAPGYTKMLKLIKSFNDIAYNFERQHGGEATVEKLRRETADEPIDVIDGTVQAMWRSGTQQDFEQG